MSRPNFLESIKEKYSYEVEKPHQQKEMDIGAFKKFNDYVNQNPNQDLWEWTGKQAEVVESKNSMMDIFNLYVFEMLKPQFVAFCKENSFDVIDNYVETTINASKNYVSPLQEYETEMQQMRDIIKQQALIIEQQTTKSEVIKI